MDLAGYEVSTQILLMNYSISSIIIVVFLTALCFIIGIKKPRLILFTFVVITAPLPINIFNYQSGSLYIGHVIFVVLIAILLFHIFTGRLRINIYQWDTIILVYSRKNRVVFG